MQADFQTPVRGATIDTATLIANRFAGRLINVAAPSRALASLAGQRRTRQRGRGLEFEEVREYVPGDDIRAIDWRVTARSGEAHTKLFHEDHEQPVTVAVDLRGSMKFGSRYAFKSVVAAHAASLVLWSGLDRGERVGAMVLHHEGVAETRAQRSRNTVLHALGSLGEYGQPDQGLNRQGAPALGDLLLQLQRHSRPGSRVFLFSDFSDGLDDAALQALRQLAKRTQLVAMHVSDPLERHLPAAGSYSVADGNAVASLDTADAGIRDSYQQEYERRLNDLRSHYRDYRVPLVELSTDTSPLLALQRLFPAR